MLPAVWQRRAHDLHGRHGRNTDPAYKYRKLLTCNLENLSVKQTGRLKEILESDTELAVVYAIKEHVRDLLKTSSPQAFHAGWEKLSAWVKASEMDEAKSILRTFTAWKKELETYCLTRLTNAHSEAANLTAKSFKRMGRGFLNRENYRLRILLFSARDLRPC